MSSYVLSILYPLIIMAVIGVPRTEVIKYRSEILPKQENTEVVERSVKLPNGVKLTYAVQGDPEGTPVILLHGWTDSWHSFYRVLPFLPDSFQILAPNLRGHGDSDRPAEGYGPEDFATDLGLFMDALEVEPAVIVGFSMGSVAAQRFAIDNPERVRGLVLMGTPTNFSGKPGVIELWKIVQALEDPIDPGFIREFNAGVPAQPVPDDFLEIINRENMKVPARVWKAAFKGVMDANFSDELPGVKAPALILWGDQEVFTTEAEQRSLASKFPRARFTIYKGHGHALHWEAPERFATDLVEFIACVSDRN